MALPLEVHGSGYTQMQMISNTKVIHHYIPHPESSLQTDEIWFDIGK
jgi:hypothetical protein